MDKSSSLKPALAPAVMLDVAERAATLAADAEIEVLHDLEDLLDELRRQAHRRLVEQDGAGPAHQRTADRRHLLLAARGVAGLAGAPFPEAREVMVDLLQVVGDLAALAAVDEGAGQQVFLDGEMAEAVAAL